jgi:hypothetical protein
VSVVGVVIDDELGAAQEVAAEHQLRYPSAFDAAGEVARAYAVTGTPETYLIGADGTIAAMWIGPLPAAELELQLAIATESEPADRVPERGPGRHPHASGPTAPEEGTKVPSRPCWDLYRRCW